jgi:hypothetical protein
MRILLSESDSFFCPLNLSWIEASTFTHWSTGESWFKQMPVLLFWGSMCRVPTIRGTHNQRLRKTKPLPINGTSQNSGRDASTMFRLVRGSLDGTPRLRSDSYEAPSTGRLDCVPTRTRLARQGISAIGKSPTRTTPGRAARPTLFTNSETKVRAFNATTYYFLSSWLQQ